MEWERAKTYILVFFLLLNAALGILLAMENRRYTMTGEQEALIRTVLAQNNITIYRMDMRDFPPMRPIEITGFYYDEETIQSLVHIFFPPTEDVERVDTGREGHHLFLYGDSRLEIANGFIEYRNPHGLPQLGGASLLLQPPAEVTRDSARRQANQFINTHFPDYVYDADFEERGNWRVIYRQKYNGLLIHSNFIEILVAPVGIQQVEMQFGAVRGPIGSPLMIFSPDEALLAFTQRVRHITQEEPMTITRMDLVYFQEYISDQEGPYHAEPFYRIFTAGNEAVPFLVNAFTNVVD
jgi:hypothetical protein